MPLTQNDYRAALLQAFRAYRHSDRYTKLGAYRMAKRMIAPLPDDRATQELRDIYARYCHLRELATPPQGYCPDYYGAELHHAIPTARECWAQARWDVRSLSSF